MITCEYRQDTICLKASEMAGITANTKDSVCTVCLTEPTRTNYVTASLALNVIPHPRPEDKKYLINLLKRVELYTEGPGTELKKLLSWFHSPPKKKCKCKDRIQKMNAWGPDKCEEKIETILRWLKHSARIHKVPYFAFAVRIVIKKAIKNARKTTT